MDNSDVQSNSYCPSEGRSRHGGYDVPYNTSTITGGIPDNQVPGIWQNLALPGYNKTAHGPSHLDPLFTEPSTPCNSLLEDAPLEKNQPNDFSLNGHSYIGSQFELDASQDYEGGFFTDLLFCQDVTADIPSNPNGTAAEPTSFQDHCSPFNPICPASTPVPPAVFPANVYSNHPYSDVSISITHTGRAVVPTSMNPWFGPREGCFSTDPTTPSRTSPSIASVYTIHPNGQSKSNHPCYEASPRAASTQRSPHNPATSPNYPGIVTISSSIAVTKSSNAILKYASLGPESSASLASMETLKPSQTKAIDDQEHKKRSDTIPSRKPSTKPRLSVTRRDSDYGFSSCPWPGCSTITRKKNHKSNMRNHVRMTHERPAPPMCELCGRVFGKNESLKRHLKKESPKIDIPRRESVVRKIMADGTLYSTYHEVYDHVRERSMLKF
ncbi:hypothetical protein IMSHALPRED_011137 [Imshaugia aleurites]|uniref:C2H2-type domain-containing protein n=1 Tax=Imshaugia aleurites TaxID=172621 RepID=A0A8H3J085_9LECA|nr:hypothetical protein IMSHALPRED_011137 [Imshaugia aleurites]